MLSSIGRLIAITVGVLTLTVSAVVFMRSVGLKQQFEAPPHAWFGQKAWNIYAPDLAELCGANTPVVEGWILRVPVLRLGGTWQLPCPGPSVPLQDFLARSQQKQILL